MRILAWLVAALISATIGLMLAATFWPLGCPFSLVGSSRCEDAVVFVLPCCWLLFGIAGFGFANRIMARFAQKVDR